MWGPHPTYNHGRNPPSDLPMREGVALRLFPPMNLGCQITRSRVQREDPTEYVIDRMIDYDPK